MAIQLLVSLEELQFQHNYLFNLLFELKKSISNNQTEDGITDLLEKLHQYSQFHFQAENLYAQQNDSSLSEQHQAEHAHFIAMLIEIRDHARNNHLKASIITLNFITTWLTEHINKTDQQYR